MTKKKKQTKKNIFDMEDNNIIKGTSIQRILFLFLLSRLFLIIFLIINKDLSILKLYDSIHYVNMAKLGYTNPMLYAFFPLYPATIKILSFIIPSYYISGALISNICSLLSIFILNELTKDRYNLWYILCFIFSPILAFTSIVYTESIFIFLTLLGYYLYKKDKYFLSAIIVGLSCLTRNSGIILWGAIGLDMLYRLLMAKDKTIKFKNIIIFGITALLIALIYPTYLYIKTGNFLEFISVQTEYWYRETGTIFDGIIKDIKVLIRKPDIVDIIVFLENWISLFLTLILGIKIFKKDKVASIYTIVSLVAFSTTYRNIDYWYSLSSISLFRYIFNLFPIYIYLFDNKKESINKIIYMTFILLSTFNTILVYLGVFIA